MMTSDLSANFVELCNGYDETEQCDDGQKAEDGHDQSNLRREWLESSACT